MKIIEVCRVPPAPALASNTLPTPTSIPLTFFDIHWLRLPPVQRLFFYEFSHPTSVFFDSLLPKLKHSLSLALHYFFPLAAQLTWPLHSNKPIIKCAAGDAVSLTIAESDADFTHLSGTDLCEATECHHLIPHLAISHEQASVLALQITLFPNSGCCVGITSHHAVLDGKTSTSFMKSWAYLCKRVDESSCSLAPELIPFYDRGVIADPNALETKYVGDWLKEGGPNNRSLMVWDLKVPPEVTRGTFELTRPQIERLKQIVGAKQKGNRPLSTFVLSCAYAWVCIVRAEEMKGNQVRLAMNVDCRPRLEPPLPATYFGNCIACRLAVTETRRLFGEDGLVVAVEAMGAALETLKDGVLNGAETSVSVLHGSLNTDDKTIGCAGSPRFEVYGTDFGWGRPKKVEMSSIDRTGAICVSDSRNGDKGIEIGLVLKKGAMEAFASLFIKGLESL